MVKKWTITSYVIILAFAISACGGSNNDPQPVAAQQVIKKVQPVVDQANAKLVKQCKKIGHTKQSDIDTCVEGYKEIMNAKAPTKEELANADEYERSCLELGSRGKELKDCAEGLRALAKGMN